MNTIIFPDVYAYFFLFPLSFLLCFGLFICRYQSQQPTDIKTSVLYVGNKPSLITLDYIIKMNNENNEFRLSYYPHKLSVFSQILSETFGPRMVHTVCGDFKSLNEVENPAFYVHIVEKN